MPSIKLNRFSLKFLLLEKSVILNVIASYGTSVSSMLLSLIFTPVFIWYLGIESFGIIGFINSLMVFINFLDLGMGASINREMAKHFRDPSKALFIYQLNFSLQIIYIIVGVIISLVLIGSSSFLANRWFDAKDINSSTLKYALIILSITIACRWPYSYYSSALRGMQYQVLLSGHEIMWNTLKSAGSWVLLKYFSANLTEFLWYQCVIIGLQTLSSATIVWYFIPKVKVAKPFSFKAVRSISRFAGTMGVSALIVAFIFESDKLILSKILTGPQFGYYMFSVGIAILVYSISMPLGMAIFPHFTAAYHANNISLIEHDFHKYTRILTVLLLPFALMLGSFTKEILLLWTQNPEIVANAAVLIRVMLIGTVLHAFMAVPHVLVMAKGNIKFMLYCNIVAFILIVPVTIFLSTHYGALGGAIGYSIIFGGYFWVQAPLLIRSCLPGNVKKWYWNDIFKIAFPLISIISLIRFFVPEQYYSGITGLFFMSIIGLMLLVIAYIMSGLNMVQNFFKSKPRPVTEQKE